MVICILLIYSDGAVMTLVILGLGFYGMNLMDENMQDKRIIEIKTEQLKEHINSIKTIVKKENLQTIDEFYQDFPLTKLTLEELTFAEPSYISLVNRKNQFASIYRKKNNVFACIADDLSKCFDNFKLQMHSNNIKYLCNSDTCYRAK